MELNVDPKYKHKKSGDPCPGCGMDTLCQNHDNIECIRSCGYVDWDNHLLPRTGIYVRAKFEGRYGNYDITELDDASLSKWFEERLNPEGRMTVLRLLLGRKDDLAQTQEKSQD